MRSTIASLAFTSTLALMAALPAHAVVYTPDFSTMTGISVTGSAGPASTSDGNVLRMTTASGSQAGAAYFTSPITLGSGDIFSTQFQFRFTQPGGWDPADGITFVLAASTSGLGGLGVGMGYAGVPNSVAIEFDTYNNTGYGLGDDDGNSSNHISIDTDGNLNNADLTNVYGNGSCGFPVGGTPDQNDYTAPGCMSNGDLWTVNIVYDGTDMTVTARDGAMTAFTAIDSFPIDIASYLGTNQAYVGFTSGTGAGWENHDIVDWQFADTTQLAPQPPETGGVPEPMTLSLFGAGVAGLARMRRRSLR